VVVGGGAETSLRAYELEEICDCSEALANTSPLCPLNVAPTKDIDTVVARNEVIARRNVSLGR